ncbi:hypothetical protein AX16_001437 [Volvariella volvacea WC 439]|nr:hypothetical protein AX16_001437 [Volvariella volvacea WC 439]
MDRALYIWGCSRTGCQKKEGSVRAWRGLRYNDEYAAKLAKKRAQKTAKKPVVLEQKPPAAKPNPFSVSNSGKPNPFGLGAQIFSSAPSTAPLTGDDDSDAESEASTSSEKSLLTAMAATTLTESDWVNAPAFDPLYLSTVSEYLPPLPKVKLPAGVEIVDPSDEKDVKDVSWASEAYEDSMEVDKVFERFNKIVGFEGEQCVRYDLGGRPLLFASDTIFDLLFPKPPAPAIQTVTKAAFTVTPPAKRTFDLSAVPPCPRCKGRRVFECQLMPNLINVLSKSDGDRFSKLTDDERRKALEKALKGADADGEGMEWGTCLVFSCETDCCTGDDGTESKTCWREEYVLVQWDT